MSTEPEAVTQTPPPVTESPPPPPVSAPDPLQAAAEEARRYADAAREQAELARSKAESLAAAEAEARQKEEQHSTRYEDLMRRLEEREARLAAREKADLDSVRIKTLRQMGVTGSLSDEQILTLTPEVDPATEAGRTALDEWRTANNALFLAPKSESSEAVKAKIQANIAATPHRASRVFGPEFLDEMVRKVLG